MHHLVCFIQLWLSFFAPIIPQLISDGDSPIFIDNPNSDNGALVAAMALLTAHHALNEEAYLHCLSSLHTNRMYPEAQCFENLHTHLYRVFGPAERIDGSSSPGKIRVHLNNFLE
jgi:hypothetical protein